jgi:hypothetical protein
MCLLSELQVQNLQAVRLNGLTFRFASSELVMYELEWADIYVELQDQNLQGMNLNVPTLGTESSELASCAFDLG